MELIDWIYSIAAVFSTIAAVLAWVAKIRWSDEYREAKEETIKSKEAHIEMLQNEVENLHALTPIKMREYFESTKDSLEEFVEVLQTQLDDAKSTLKKKGDEIKELESQNREIGRLQQEKETLTEAVDELEEEVEDLSTQLQSIQSINRTIPTINIPLAAQAAVQMSSAVATLLADQQTQMSTAVMHSMERLRSQIGASSMYIDPATGRPDIQPGSVISDAITVTGEDNDE
jgi:DNA repair exonuclease SbcCD ATPase subunit